MFEGPQQPVDEETQRQFVVAIWLLVLTIILLGSLLIVVFLPRLFRGKADGDHPHGHAKAADDPWAEAGRRMAGAEEGEDGESVPHEKGMDEAPDDRPPPDDSPDDEDDSDDDTDFREDLGGRL